MVIALALLLASAQELLVKGVTALKAGDIAQAQVALEEAARLSPGEPVIWLAVAEARLRGGDTPAAVSAVNRASKLAPNSAVVTRGRALFARRLGDTAQSLLDTRQEKKAATLLKTALQEFATEPALWRLFGLSLYAQGQNGLAVEAFVRAIDLAPEEEMLYAGLETLLPAGKTVEDRLDQFTSRHPDSALGWYLLGLEKGDSTLWEKALKLDPDFWPAMFALQKTVSPGEAVRLLERVVELNPRYAPAYYALSQVYGRLGEREKAKAARTRHHEMTRPK